MRKTTVFILISGLLAGVLFTSMDLLGGEKEKYNVAVKLERVEREPPMDTPGQIQDGLVFIGEPMAVAWSPAPQGFRFRVYNKSTSTITILWNECTFIDEKGNSHNITHKGVKRHSSSDMEMKSMNPTVIDAGNNWQDVFFPYDSDYIQQEKELKGFSTDAGASAVDSYDRAGLRIRPIFTDKYRGKDVKKIMKKQKKKDPDLNFEKYIESHTYIINMVLKLGENKATYRFLFRAHLLAEH
jgi:hypothetical protein